jgi:hypothetical protein
MPYKRPATQGNTPPEHAVTMESVMQQVCMRLEIIAEEQRKENERITKSLENSIKQCLAKAQLVSRFHGGVWMEMDVNQSFDDTKPLVRVAPFWETWIETGQRTTSTQGTSNPATTISHEANTDVNTEDVKPSAIFSLPTECRQEWFGLPRTRCSFARTFIIIIININYKYNNN